MKRGDSVSLVGRFYFKGGDIPHGLFFAAGDFISICGEFFWWAILFRDTGLRPGCRSAAALGGPPWET